MTVVRIFPGGESAPASDDEIQRRAALVALFEDLKQMAQDGKVAGFIAGVANTDGDVVSYAIGLSMASKVGILDRMRHRLHCEWDRES